MIIPHPSTSMLLGACIGICLIGTNPAHADPQARPGDPLQSLSEELLIRFEIGRIAFNTDLAVEDGLGPIFNQTSCGSCHNNPVGGPGNQTVTRFGHLDKKGGFDGMDDLGGSLLQAQAISDECAEIIPAGVNVMSLRVTNGVLAYGLVEAISDQDLLDNMDAQPEAQRGIAHMVSNFEDDTDELHVGRFGWKAQVASVLTFSSDASQNEMGLSNRFLPFDNAPNGDEELLAQCDLVADPEDSPDADGFEFIDRVTDFQRFLAPPPQTPKSGMTGEVIFNQLGCAVCHTPSFVTSNNPEVEPVLRNQPIQPYGDFLLHDMGLAGDGIVQGAAGARELKTPPLWGIAYRDPLWHDGRFDAGAFESRMTNAIEEHGVFGSQGIPAANAFTALTSKDQGQLFNFLSSLGQVEFDSDDDGDVELNDFHGYFDTIGFVGCFNSTLTPDDPCAIHDVDQDGDIDLDDFDVFLVAFDGEIADCNSNGVADMIEILQGAIDNDNNGILDECQTCHGDLNGDSMIGISDLLAVIDLWGPCSACEADFNDDGFVNVTDLLFLIGHWGPCS